MIQEQFFRLLSIALLGAGALAFVPETQADLDNQDPQMAAVSMNYEMEATAEIEEINKDLFKPYLAGDTAPKSSLTVSDLNSLAKSLPAFE